MRCAAVLAGAGLACTPPAGPKTPRAVGAVPSWRSDGQGPVRAHEAAGLDYAALAAAPMAATHYNAATRPAPIDSPVHREVAARITEVAVRARLAAPERDGRLDWALTTLAAALPEGGMLPNAAVEFAMRRHGIVEPSPTLLILWGPPHDVEGLGQQLERSLAEMVKQGDALAYGVGVATKGEVAAIIVGIMPREVVLAPVPRAVARGGAFALEGALAAHLHTPQVVVTHDDGSIARYPAGKGPQFAASVPCDGRVGQQQLEVTADGPQGATVVANFPVWCGVSAPTTLAPVVMPGEPLYGDVAGAEAAMLELVNADRRAASLAPLQPDARLVELGRAHSRDMKASGVVAHRSVTTGDASDRVKRAGVQTSTILENVARAVGVAEAHEALMNSPGHRANLMSPTATHVGIGIEFGEVIGGLREVYVTQVFILIPPKADRAALIARIERDMAGRRLVRDGELASVAQRIASELAAGKSTQAASALLDRLMPGLAPRFRSVGSAIAATASPEALDLAALAKGAAGRFVGVGVAQGRHPELGENTVWVVLLYGVAR